MTKSNEHNASVHESVEVVKHEENARTELQEPITVDTFIPGITPYDPSVPITSLSGELAWWVVYDECCAFLDSLGLFEGDGKVALIIWEAALQAIADPSLFGFEVQEDILEPTPDNPQQFRVVGKRHIMTIEA